MPDLHGRAWIESVTGRRVEGSTALPGATSSSVSLIELEDATRLVLRHVEDHRWRQRDPGLLAREATALGLLERSPVRTPRFVAMDEADGLLLMTWLDGRMITDQEGLRDRVASMGRLAARIAATPLHACGLPAWSPWVADDVSPPVWGDRDLWRRAIARYREGHPDATEADPVLLHRDLHPLNLLWTDADIGVVDWVNACVGPPQAELAHLRWNLAVLAGPDSAGAATRHYLDAVGHERYDPWWDLTTALGLLPGPIERSGWVSVGLTHLTDSRLVRATETFVRTALDG